MAHTNPNARTMPYAAFLQRALTVFIVASAVNYPWEVGQIKFYDVSGTLAEIARHCLIPSFGDGVLVLLIYMLGLYAFKRLNWIDRPGFPAYSFLLGVGLLVALAVEWLGVYGLGRWRYNELMPLIPVLNVGILPILQMLLLPPFIFYLVARCFRSR